MSYPEQQMQQHIEYGISEAERCYNEIGQLKDRIKLLEQAVRYEADLAEQAISEREGLKAQVEQLRVASTIVLNARDEDGITTSGLLAKFDALSKALSFLPAQCLAEVKAQAGRDGFIAGYFHCRNEGFQFEDELENSADAYANQLRQQAKE